jgi:predicted N-acetyltransferase YhbS
MKVLNRSEDAERSAEYDRLSSYDLYKKIDTCWHLGLLAVAPKFQRRGIGQKLVQHCQKLAAEDGVPVTLEASVVGRGLYTKLGFKVAEQVKITDEFDGVAMLWEPEQLKGKWLEDLGGERAKVKA